MTQQPFATDVELEATLRDLGSAIEWPIATPAEGPDLAARVAARIAAGPDVRPRPAWWAWPTARDERGRTPRLRLALILALVALLIAAVAVIGTVGFGWDGFRIVFGQAPIASPTPQASAGATTSPPGPPGSAIGLGLPSTLAELDTAIEFRPLLPAADRLGPPDAVYVSGGRLSLVWAPRPDLPADLNAGVGLLVTEIPGSIHGDWIKKIISGGTRVQDVTVAGQRGFWIEGDPHFFMVVAPDGAPVTDSRRAVGDTLVWQTGGLTIRIESGLGRDATLALAETFH
jgi:hypothetical protein